MVQTAILAAAPCPPRLPRITLRTALFLDFDGTLVDIAPQPDSVCVPTELTSVLRQLGERLEGALAIVSGRSLRDLDRFLSPLSLATAAEHGAQNRLASGEMVSVAAPDLRRVANQAEALASSHAGLRVEIKSFAVALHYRQAPTLQALCLLTMQDAASRTPGVELLHGKCVIEIKPAGVSKGTAIRAFMAQAAFAGRWPLFAGDDVTDESGFAVVQALGGQGIKVGDGPTMAQHHCASPALLRQWLAAAAGESGP